MGNEQGDYKFMGDMDNLQFHAQDDPMGQKINFYLSGQIGDRIFSFEQPRAKEIHGRFAALNCTLEFGDKSQLQNLMDDLWNMGLRPSFKSDEYKGQLQTVTNHLNDMRALVFKQPRADIVLP